MPPFPRLPPPFLEGAYVVPERVSSWHEFPFSLPVVRDLRIELDTAVTILVGENGCGKSTLLQAMAVLAGAPATGGDTQHRGMTHDLPHSQDSVLARAMRPMFRERPSRTWLFRADLQASFAQRLHSSGGKHFYGNDRDAIFTDRALHQLSHGESFLAVLHNRANQGLLFLDEPESALSPQRQLSLLAMLARSVRTGRTQVVIATHSPLLMTFPGARLLSLDGGEIRPTTLEQTKHYEITRGMLECPERYWKHLLEVE
ncbi:MAG: AAA family ATPase [Alphaproteobacteria bacterium]|nr:AAA family ATPase [Alphaproteobacteria bacterium]